MRLVLFTMDRLLVLTWVQVGIMELIWVIFG